MVNLMLFLSLAAYNITTAYNPGGGNLLSSFIVTLSDSSTIFVVLQPQPVCQQQIETKQMRGIVKKENILVEYSDL